MRKTFLIFIYTFSICFLFGQSDDQELWTTWYLKPLHGKTKQLEKGIIDHVKNTMVKADGQSIISRS